MNGGLDRDRAHTGIIRPKIIKIDTVLNIIFYETSLYYEDDESHMCTGSE